MNSSLDLLLNDSTSTHPKKPATSLDWLFSSSALDVLAPHPDAFDSELDSIALGSLDADLAALPAISIDPFFHQDINFYQYRAHANQATSQYSGYGGTITSSESLSAYGSVYDPPSQQPHDNSLSSLFPDLDFSSFDLAPSSPSVEDIMLNGQSDARTNSNTTARSSDSPSFDATSPSAASGSVSPTFYPITASAALPVKPSTYLGPAAVKGPSAGSAVPLNGNSSLITGKLSRDGPAHEGDPRKKYACPSCPRAFARAFNLKTHMATHDPQRVKNFHCRHSGCGRSFSRKHDLGRHMVSIHQDTSTPVASASSSATATSASTIGVGSTARIWCDNCGRGWVAGSRDACECDPSEHRVH